MRRRPARAGWDRRSPGAGSAPARPPRPPILVVAPALRGGSRAGTAPRRQSRSDAATDAPARRTASARRRRRAGHPPATEGRKATGRGDCQTSAPSWRRRRAGTATPLPAVAARTRASTMIPRKSARTAAAGRSGGASARSVNARQAPGMARASRPQRSASGPVRTGFQPGRRRVFPMGAISGRNCSLRRQGAGEAEGGGPERQRRADDDAGGEGLPVEAGAEKIDRLGRRQRQDGDYPGSQGHGRRGVRRLGDQRAGGDGPSGGGRKPEEGVYDLGRLAPSISPAFPGGRRSGRRRRHGRAATGGEAPSASDRAARRGSARRRRPAFLPRAGIGRRTGRRERQSFHWFRFPDRPRSAFLNVSILPLLPYRGPSVDATQKGRPSGGPAAPVKFPSRDSASPTLRAERP